jgi:hypothetical protein
MAKTPKPRLVQERTIIGLSLRPERAAEFKMEAAKRGITMKKLFDEMWDSYKKKSK